MRIYLYDHPAGDKEVGGGGGAQQRATMVIFCSDDNQSRHPKAPLASETGQTASKQGIRLESQRKCASSGQGIRKRWQSLAQPVPPALTSCSATWLGSPPRGVRSAGQRPRAPCAARRGGAATHRQSLERASGAITLRATDKHNANHCCPCEQRRWRFLAHGM